MTLGISLVKSDRTWVDFVTQPVSFVHPTHLAACFEGCAMEPHILSSMAREPRFQERLRRLLEQRFEVSLSLDVPVPRDIGPTHSPMPDLDVLARECGAVYWSEAFIQEIRAPAVRAQRERFGEHLHTLALVHHDLAGSEPLPADLDALDQAVSQAGEACLQAWLAQQSISLVTWLKLTVSSERPPAAQGADIRQLGPQILRRVIAGRITADLAVEAS
jgi:hypothetical protein